MQKENPLEVTLLGRAEVKRENTLLTNFRHRKSLALLAYLAVTGERYSRESLAGLLWGQASSDTNALGGLRKVLAELRNLIGPYLLEHDRQVAFNSELPSHIDVLDFEKDLSGILGQKAEMLDTESSNALRRAIDLYQGDFLSGFYVQHAPVFEEWVTLTRERLRLSALEGLYLLSKAAYRQSEYSEAIHYTRRLLEIEPCYEEAHRQLMSLFALTGQRELALRQYENCRDIMAETYDLAPQEETTALNERIRQESIKTEQGTGFDLPTPAMPLLGRQNDIAKLRERLADPACRLLTIVGPGGSGKTHLALELAAVINQSTNTYVDGIAFVPLSALRRIGALPSAIAYQMGFQFHKEESPLKQLIENLANSHILLILDNFEHLLQYTDQKIERPMESSVDMLSQFVQEVPHVNLLITSRVRLNLTEEHVYLLGGIEYPKTKAKITSASVDAPAVALFIQSARRIAPDFEIDDDSLTEIVEICQRVRGLPLGIMLAASWSNLLSPAQINARLSTESGLDLLENETGSFPLRQRSLRAVLAYSWKMLSADEQATLAALSAFRGDFNLEAAQEIGNATLNSLRSLIDHSLLRRKSTGRYAIHEFTRQFADEKLDDRMQVEDRFWNYYGPRITDWAVDLKSARQFETIKILDNEIDNLRAAWDMAVRAENLSFIARAIDGLCLYYSLRQRFTEGLNACRMVVAYFQDENIAPEKKNLLQSKLLFAKSLAWLGALSSLFQAKAPLQQSLSILDTLEDEEMRSYEAQTAMAFTCNELASVCSETGEHAKSKELFMRCIQICEQTGNRWLLADSLKNRASQLWNQSDYEQSKQCLMRGLKILEEIGDQRLIAASLSWLGITTLFQGDPQGVAYIRKSVDIYTELGQQILTTIEVAAVALIVAGNYEEARALIEERGRLDLKIPFRQDSIQSVMAAILTHLGRYTEAKEFVQIDIGRNIPIASPYSLGFAFVARGWLALVDGENAYARELFQNSVKQCDQYGLKDIHVWALSSYGFAVYRSGNLSAARGILIKALKAAREMNGFVGKVFAVVFGLPLIGQIKGSEFTIKLYSGMLQVPMFANSVFFNKIIGQEIELLANNLPKEIIDKIKKNGRMLELEEMINMAMASLTGE